MKDRLSVHINNGQSDVFEAVTVLRNGGTVSQSGLVGITNITHTTSENPIVPETILNVQSDTDCDTRLTSTAANKRTSIQLLSHSNTRTSGVELSYGGSSKIFDVSLIKPNGSQGTSSGIISVSDNGVVIGSTHLDYSSRVTTPSSPLVISQNSSNSGTVSLRQQSNSPSAADNFGSLFVKEYYVDEVQGNALFYKDPSGVELNLAQNPLDVQSNLFFHDGAQGNTFVGYESPKTRHVNDNTGFNTSLGYRALYSIDYNSDWNVAIGAYSLTNLNGSTTTNDPINNVGIGHSAGFGIITGDHNIAIGGQSEYYSDGNRNVTLGYLAGGYTTHDDCVIIGNQAGWNASVPDATLLIGTGTYPLISGSFSDKTLTVRDGSFNCQNTTESIGLKNHLTTGVLEIVDRGDNDNFASLETSMSIVFTTSDKESGVLMNFKHNADPMSAVSASTYHPFTDTPDRPYAELNGDLRLLGDIKFSDGTYLSSTSSLGTEGGTGIKLSSHHAGPNTRYNLDFETLTDSLSLSDSIDTSQSFIAVSVPSGSENPVTRLSVQGLTDLVESGFATVGNNCNMLFTSTENEIDTYKNRNSVFVGCSAGSAATGWKNGVFIGTEAGKAATTPNGGLPSNGVDTPVVFIGNSAGFDADNVTEAIFIGNEAGKNSSGAEESIFIGPNAGTNSNFKYSIGIGKNALFGDKPSTIEVGSGNIEMTTAVHGDSRLFYNVDKNTSNKVNIGNVVAGDMENKKLSIGVAELSPSAILDVKFSSNANHSEAGHVQAWWTDDNPSCAISSAPASGFMQSDPNPGKESILRPIFMDAKVGGSQIPKNGGSRDDVQIWVDGFATSPAQYIKVTNRGNSNIAAHRFIVVVKIGNEYRAINGL